MFNLAELTHDFALAVQTVDAREPVAHNARSKEQFKPGIGPHSECAALSLIFRELSACKPDKYVNWAMAVKYPETEEKCDVCFGVAPEWSWVIEVKLLRFVGDNDKPNDYMIMHLLSPYPQHRSALTDIDKLRKWQGPKRKAILIYGFEHRLWQLAPAIDAFEVLASYRGAIGERCRADFFGLVHPVHRKGSVFAWELLG